MEISELKTVIKKFKSQWTTEKKKKTLKNKNFTQYVFVDIARNIHNIFENLFCISRVLELK